LSDDDDKTEAMAEQAIEEGIRLGCMKEELKEMVKSDPMVTPAK